MDIDTLTSDLQEVTLESKEKQKDQGPSLKLPDDSLVVDTEQTFDSAVVELREYATWIIDCEGVNLGTQGGTLSILSIRGIPATAKTLVSLPKTFLFDIVLLTHPETGCSIRPLLDLLASPSIKKVFFDGRMDFCALYFGYGAELSNVVDLQVVEMRKRFNEENPQKQFQRLMRFFAPREFQNPRKVGKYVHIHLLQGLGGSLKENKVVTETPKGSVDHDSWMIRPLSDAHLFYAANDVYLMELLLTHFEDRGLIDNAILPQSHRYVTIWRDQQPLEGDVFRSNPFFALEILEWDENSSRKACNGCGRNLSQRSFPNDSWSDSQREARLCHVCNLIPTWQRRQRFFAELKVKKKEEQERKQAEAERKKTGEGKDRTGNGTLEQNSKTVVDHKPKAVVHDDSRSTAKGASVGGNSRAAIPNVSGKEPKPSQEPTFTTTNTSEKQVEVAEDRPKGFSQNPRGKASRGVARASTSTNRQEQDGTHHVNLGFRGGANYVRGAREGTSSVRGDRGGTGSVQGARGGPSYDVRGARGGIGYVRGARGGTDYVRGDGGGTDYVRGTRGARGIARGAIGTSPGPREQFVRAGESVVETASHLQQSPTASRGRGRNPYLRRGRGRGRGRGGGGGGEGSLVGASTNE